MLTDKQIIQISNTEHSIFQFDESQVAVAQLPKTNDFIIELKTASEDHSVRSIHRIEEGNIVVTGVRVSKEAAFCILLGLREQLEKYLTTENH